jgi:hypothetical protein
MIAEIASNLQDLAPPSNKRLHTTTRALLVGRQGRQYGAPLALVKQTQVGNAHWRMTPRADGETFRGLISQQSIRKVCTLSEVAESALINDINRDLIGATGYPVLTAILGVGAGIVSFGAGLFFTVGTTALSLAHATPRILARDGDEVWQIEEIGRVGSGSKAKVFHVNSIFIVDPHRANAKNKGWLIHEERSEVVF